MTRDTLQSICLPALTTIKQAIETFNATGQKILLIVNDDGVLQGTVTDGDIRRGLLRGHGMDSTVATIVCTEYGAVPATDAQLHAHARALMLERHIMHVPVVDHALRVCDVIVWSDVLGQPATPQPVPRYEHEVVIMAGGKGARLDPFTQVLPKPLIPIGEKPVIELIMERFSEQGFYKFTYTLNYKKEYIKLFLRERQFPYTISWKEEDTFLGTAGSLSLLKGHVRDTFFVVNCDTILTIDFHDVLRWHRAHGAAMTVVGAHSEVRIPYGVLLHGNGTLERIQEKPNHEVLVNTGMYVVEPEVIDRIPAGTSMDMNELINALARDRHVAIYPVYGRDWLDIGQWDQYRKHIVRLSAGTHAV